MIPNDATLRGPVVEQMIRECKENPNKLSQWEFDFVYSIADQLSKGKILSKTQCDKLEQIYDKLD